MPEKFREDSLNGEAVDNTGMAGESLSPDVPGMPNGEISGPGDALPGQAGKKSKPHIIRLARSLGMVMPSNRVRKFLGRGAIPPVSERKHFVARLKHLDKIEVVIVEGDDEQADKNVVVGEVGLSNIRLREDGRAEVEVDFTLEDQGMLVVTVTDRLTTTDCYARFVLPQFNTEQVSETEISHIPVSDLSQKIDLLEQQMMLLKGELTVRRERDKKPS